MRNIHAFPLSGSFSHASSNSGWNRSDFLWRRTRLSRTHSRTKPGFKASTTWVPSGNRSLAEASCGGIAERCEQSTSMRSLAMLGLSNLDGKTCPQPRREHALCPSLVFTGPCLLRSYRSWWSERFCRQAPRYHVLRCGLCGGTKNNNEITTCVNAII